MSLPSLSFSESRIIPVYNSGLDSELGLPRKTWLTA